MPGMEAVKVFSDLLMFHYVFSGLVIAFAALLYSMLSRGGIFARLSSTMGMLSFSVIVFCIVVQFAFSTYGMAWWLWKHDMPEGFQNAVLLSHAITLALMLVLSLITAFVAAFKVVDIVTKFVAD